MNLDSLKAKLRTSMDVNKDGKVDIHDVAVYVQASTRNTMIATAIVAGIVGVLIGKFAL